MLIFFEQLYTLFAGCILFTLPTLIDRYIFLNPLSLSVFYFVYLVPWFCHLTICEKWSAIISLDSLGFILSLKGSLMHRVGLLFSWEYCMTDKDYRPFPSKNYLRPFEICHLIPFLAVNVPLTCHVSSHLDCFKLWF